MWVGNLSPQVSETDLRNAFSTFGIVQAVKYLPHKGIYFFSSIIKNDTIKKKNAGCAFIRFSDTQTAMYAYQNMNGYFLQGKPLKLGWGKETPTAVPEMRENNATSNLWIGNVGPTVTEEDLRNLFGHYGVITNIRMLLPKNCAFVNFDNVDTAVKVKNEMQGYYFAGQNLKINFGKELKPSIFNAPTTVTPTTTSHPGLGYQTKTKPNEPIYSQILQGATLFLFFLQIFFFFNLFITLEK